MEILIERPEDMDRAVRQLLAYAGKRRIFALSGEIGAGKTTFVQAFCRHFGVKDEVTSPTFGLVNQYNCKTEQSGPESVIYHLDLYRLEHFEEALDIGIEEILDGHSFCLIEWPEIVEPILPEDTVWIKIEIVENSTRKILFL